MTRPIVITAGGTGGHMFPALALAAELERRGLAVALACDRRGARFLDAEQEPFLVTAGSPSGGLVKRLRGMSALGLGLAQSWLWLRRIRPAAVAAFGSYAAAPVGVAAGLMGIPLLVHEQNAVLGRSNRLVAKRADRLAHSYPQTRHAEMVMESRHAVTGNPVRTDIRRHMGEAYHRPEPGAPINVLVVGGSQGARCFSDVLPAALDRLTGRERSRIHLTQQCRPEDLERVGHAYAKLGFDAELKSFFADLPARLAAAHLVVSRSGATSVAEMLVLGRPSVLVPLPSSLEGDQRANAEVVEAAGAGWLIEEKDLSGERLADKLRICLDMPEHLVDMAERAKALGRPDAAASLADTLLQLCPGVSAKGPQAPAPSGGSSSMEAAA
jgi:UDP-N-acetylglucosamine--N-acetylmuramyl-(pentapeptide) pyrophosphoryl-undecaprenol N-acetylglucosamine transferase